VGTGGFPPFRAIFRPAAALGKKRFLSTRQEFCAFSGISAGASGRRTVRRISAISAISAGAIAFAVERRTPGRRTRSRSLSRPQAAEKTLVACAAMLLSRDISGL
jgi:hypothetical protein